MRLLTLMILFSLFLKAERCSGSKPGNAASPNTTNSGTSFSDAKVRTSFALEVLEELKSRKHWQRAYVLLSESGMKDRGQHVVIVDTNQQWNYRWWDQPTLNTAKERPLTATETSALGKSFGEAEILTDLAEPSFDGVAFEYWVLQRSGDNIEVDQRIFMRNPSIANDKRYEKLVNSYLILQR